MNYMESRYQEEESPEQDRWKACKPPRPKCVITQSRMSRRIENLRKEKEAAEQAKLKAKPSICKKSIVLAERAEKKFFSELSRSYTDILLASKPVLNKDLSEYLIKDSKPTSESISSVIRPQIYPKFTSESISVQRTIEIKNSSSQSKLTDSSFDYKKAFISHKHRNSARKSDLKTETQLNYRANTPDLLTQHETQGTSKKLTGHRNQNLNQSPQKTRGKSLYYMSVIERNNFWQEQKNLKLKLKRKEKKAEELRNCTFTPTMYRKVEFLY